MSKNNVIKFPGPKKRNKLIKLLNKSIEDNYLPKQEFRESSQHLVFNMAKSETDLMYIIQLATAAYAENKITEFMNCSSTLQEATIQATELTKTMLKAISDLMTEGYLL